MSEIDAFTSGLTEGPRGDGGPPPSAATEEVTTGDSWWHTRVCATCGHTFRRGDRVRLDRSNRQVRHREPGLPCAGTGATEPTEIGADVLEFSAGLLAAWPVGGGVRVVATDTVPELLSAPFAGFRRACCLFCGHTFRPGEMAVVCPCGQGRCIRAVHRDPARGLVCWESWRPQGHLAVCPVLLTRMPV